MDQSKRTLSAFKTLEEIKRYSSYDEKRLKSREFRLVSSILNKAGFVNSPLTLDTLSKKTRLSKHALRKHISSLSKAGLLYRIVYSYKSDSYIFITGYKGKDFYSLIESGRIGILSGLDKLFGPERKLKIKDFLNADISSVSFSTGNTLDETEILKILHNVHRVLWARKGSVSFNGASEEEVNLKETLENTTKEEENNILTLSNSHEESFDTFPPEDRTNIFLSNFFDFESSKAEVAEKEEVAMGLRDIFEELSKKEQEKSQGAIGYEAFEDEEDFDDDTFDDTDELNYDDDNEEGAGQHTFRYMSFRDILGKKEEEPEYIPPNVGENGKVGYINAREVFDFFKKEKEKRKKDVETMERELDEIFGFADSDAPEEEGQAPQKDTLEELQELFKQLIEVSKEKKQHEKKLQERLSKSQDTIEPGEDLERLKNIARDWKEKTSYIKEEEGKLEKRVVFSNELKEQAFLMFERINDLKKSGKIGQAKEEYRKAYEFLKQETGYVFIPREWEFGRHVIDPLDPFEQNMFNKHDYYYIEMFKNKLIHNFFGGYRFFQRLALKQLKEAGLLKGGPLDDPEYVEIAKMMGGDDDEDAVF
jgi:DNA-binding MarR family transcriptional regulator